MTNNTPADAELKRINERLARMGNAIDSNALSENAVQSEEGKAIMQHMLASVMADDFDPAEARNMITRRLAASAKR